MGGWESVKPILIDWVRLGISFMLYLLEGAIENAPESILVLLAGHVQKLFEASPNKVQFEEFPSYGEYIL